MKLKVYFRLVAACLLALGAITESSAQGARRALYIPGSGTLTPTPVATTNSYVDLGRRIQDSLATTDFTIELWVKMGNNTVNPAILGNKNWASGANTGIVLSYYASTDASSGTAAANTIRFNFKPAGGTRVDYDIVFPAAIAKKWNHLAIAVNRSGSIQGYLNGNPVGKAYTGTGSISADAGKSVADTFPMRIGTDGKPFGYRAPFDGSLDEVRIWKSVRSTADIRDNMCHTLAGSESGLMAYYRMDELSGDTVKNTAASSAGLYHGLIVNGCSRAASGAPVGDSSVNLYSSTWTGVSLKMATANRGVFTVDSFTTAGSFLHVYKVNAVPDSLKGLTEYKDNNYAFGTFASGDSFHYYPKYEYSNYANAVTYKKTIGFFNKQFNDEETWILKGKRYNDTAAKVLRLDSVQGTRLFFLANFVSSCDAAAALGAKDISARSASLYWTSGGSALWNIEYGPAGFTKGAGTKLKAVNTNPYVLSGLAGSTAYEYYVQDSCAGIGSGAWAGPFSFTTLKDLGGFGSGYALHFNGNGTVGGPVQAVTLPNALHDSLSKSDFTIEMWVKVGAKNVGNPPLIADKDYVSGANTGICFTYTATKLYGTTEAHFFRFNLMPAGGTRRDYDMRVANEFTWNHYAITVDRRGFIKGYVNGVYYPSPESTGTASIAADSAKTLTGVLPMYLGTDGTGAYRVPFNGDMDEVRVWKKVRTETEIREAMCHKLKGNETGLLAYYRLDESAGTDVANSAAATAAVMNATTWKSPAQVVSAAPIGDTSVYLYPASGWSGASLAMNTAAKGKLTIDSVNGVAVPGVHIYRVDNVPNYTTGINQIGTTDKYLGVFTAEDVHTAYRLQYDYNAYPAAVTAAANVQVYNRPDNAGLSWAQLPALNNTTTHIVSRTASMGVRQYLLADFSAAPCPAPTAVKLDKVTADSATYSWTSTAAAHYTKYGPSVYDFAADTADTVYVNKQVLTRLIDNTAYEFYLKDSCGAGSSSAWSGPYFFKTANGCPDPTDLTADSITMTSLLLKWKDEGTASSGYEISWGISGTFTDPSIGILYTSATNRYKFNSLVKKTAYDFYVRTICSGRVPNSKWVGPFTVTTDSVDKPSGLPGFAAADKALRIYPNPAKDKISVELYDHNAAGVTTLAVYNNLGMRLYAQPVDKESYLEINTASFADGVYYLEFGSAAGQLHKTFVVQH